MFKKIKINELIFYYKLIVLLLFQFNPIKF